MIGITDDVDDDDDNKNDDDNNDNGKFNFIKISFHN